MTGGVGNMWGSRAGVGTFSLSTQDTQCMDCSVLDLGPDMWLSPEPGEPG